MLYQKQAYNPPDSGTAFALVLSLQSFLVSVEQCESWISNKEVFLSNQNLGVSPAQKTH